MDKSFTNINVKMFKSPLFAVLYIPVEIDDTQIIRLKFESLIHSIWITLFNFREMNENKLLIQ